jgi:acetyl-CoA C-acetyltransferase
MGFSNRDVAVVGVYTTEQARSLAQSSFSLQREAILGALDDAGLAIGDVDGLAPMINSDYFSDSPMTNSELAHEFWAEQLGGRPLKISESGGGSGQLSKVAALIAAGLADVVVTFYGKSNLPTGPSREPIPTDGAPRVKEWAYEQTGTYLTTWYALWAQRYMHEFGVDHSDLAEVAVFTRWHATLNPDAIMGSRGEITVNDVLSSRPICSPLNLLDCSIDNDGGYAVVMASADVARDCRHAPIWVLGAAESYFTDFYLSIHDPWFPSEGRAVRTAANAAFDMAGVGRDEIDVANLYDCFTITLLRDLEEMGFCDVGDAAAFVKEGNCRLDGRLPTNTDGGLLSCSHPGDPAGLPTIEVVRQLRGDCGERQVANAELGVSLSQGYAVHGVAGVLVLAADGRRRTYS